RVAHGEALAGRAGDEHVAPGGAVEAGVAGQDRITLVVGGRADDDPSTRDALAHVVVGLAYEVELDAVGEEGAEALAGRAVEAHARRAAWRHRAPLEGDGPAEGSADRAVGVGDLVLELDLVAVPDGAE